jgi:acyl-CoA thioester hydrolase
MPMSELKGLGTFDGKTHILPISVYYEDTDLSGVVYHANLDDEEPSAWAIRRIAVEYHRPARLDDQIAVHSVLTAVSGVRMNVVQKVLCGEMLLVEARIEACMITLTGKLQRLPKKVQETLAPYVTAEET